MTLWEYSNAIHNSFKYGVNDMVYFESGDSERVYYFGIGIVTECRPSPQNPNGTNISVYTADRGSIMVAINVPSFQHDICIPLERYTGTIL